MAKSEAEKDPAAKGKLKLILLLVLALLLAVGLSVGATWFFLHQSESKPAVDPALANLKPAAIYEPLAPAFVVNFNQNGRQRFMQVSITMQGRDQAALDALKVHMPVIRNNLVMLFSGQDFATPRVAGRSGNAAAEGHRQRPGSGAERARQSGDRTVAFH